MVAGVKLVATVCFVGCFCTAEVVPPVYTADCPPYEPASDTEHETRHLMIKVSVT